MSVPPATLAKILLRLLRAGLIWIGFGIGLFYLIGSMPASAEARRRLEDDRASPAEIDRLRTLYGLDRPIHERLVCQLYGREREGCAYAPTERGLLRGDLGTSEIHREPVTTLLAERLPATLWLTIPALLLGVLGGIGLGVWAAIRQGSLIDRAIQSASFFTIALPSHWLGVLAVLGFGLTLRWLPPGGFGPGRAPDLAHLILPVGVLSLHFVGRYTRFVRAGMLDALGLEHLVACRARGLSELQVVLRHGLPHALLPLLPLLAQTVPLLFSGALVIEQVFGFPAMGHLIYWSVAEGDLAVALTVCLAYAALTLFASWLADAAHWALDPRGRA
jgi:peptide/nickel transport system permease protein